MKNIKKLQVELARLEAKIANQDTIFDRIERSKNKMAITQYRQGKAPASKYEAHGVYKYANKRAAQFALHKKYAMS